jgi:cell fate (sporulation/competence/biofilm development) regulator YlbF (YheA/YmcA/DUF963 family)
MQDIIALARQLGQKIAQDPRTAEFKKAQQELKDNPQADALLKTYQEQAEKLQKLQQENKPIEVADKHKLRDAEIALGGNPAMQQFLRCQIEFLELMRKVKESIDSELQGVE